MYLHYTFRLYPFTHQRAVLEQHRHELAYLWNHALEQRLEAWESERRVVSYSDQQRDLTRWRRVDRDGLGGVSVHAAQDCLSRLNLAFVAFLRRSHQGKRGRPAGCPRFRHSVDSFTFTPDWTLLVPGRNGTSRLKVPKVGDVPILLHRDPPDQAEVKTVTLKVEAGEWYATFSLELPDPPAPSLLPPRAPVGVDLGLTHLATLSTGETFDLPESIEETQFRIRRELKRMARKQRGSARYRRQCARVARLRAQSRRQRRDFLHRASRALAEGHDLIAFEDLDVLDLVADSPSPLGRAIQSAGWGQFREMTSYKLALQGGRCLRVSAAGTSQTCSACGKSLDVPLDLKQRTYRCTCGLTLDRDVNAARNVLSRGMTVLDEDLRRSTPEVKRVESGPSPRELGFRPCPPSRAHSRKREPAPDLSARTPRHAEIRNPPKFGS